MTSTNEKSATALTLDDVKSVVLETLNAVRPGKAQIVSEWREGKSWYRKWNTGMIEQGGVVTNCKTGSNAGNWSNNVSFRVPFSSDNVVVVGSMNDDITKYGGAVDVETQFGTPTKTGCPLRCFDANNVSYVTIGWYACGY